MQGLQNAAGENRTACAAVGGAIKVQITGFMYYLDSKKT